MKKIELIFKKIFFIIICSIPLFFCFSCSNIEKNKNINECRDFIMEHTISLMTATISNNNEPNYASDNIESTAWLFKKESNYTWYIATNWHVEYLLKSDLSADTNRKLWFTYETNPIHPTYKWTADQNHDSSYMLLNNNNYDLNDWKACCLEQERVNNQMRCWGVDFAIIKIDFSNIVENDNVFKKRLDKLSDIKIFSGDENILYNENLFYGGFPKTGFETTDNVHFTMFNFNVFNIFNYQQLEYQINPIDQENNSGWVHTAFAANQGGFMRSAANMYISNNFEANSNSGNSGSMCINDKCEVVGIFWGSFGNGTTILNECSGIDLLNVKNKNYFFEDGYNVWDLYLNNKWIDI